MIFSFPKPMNTIMKIEIEKRQEKKECGAKKCYNITSLDLFSSIFVLNLYSFLTQSLWFTYKVWDAKQKAVASIYGDFKESYAELPRFLAGLKDASPGTEIGRASCRERV